MKHLISSCKPDLRQLTTRNLLDLEALLKMLMSDLFKKNVYWKDADTKVDIQVSDYYVFVEIK